MKFIAFFMAWKVVFSQTLFDTKNHWATKPVAHTLGIKKIEETSYSEQMSLLIIYYTFMVQPTLFYVNNITKKLSL